MLIEKGTDSFLLWLADQHERALPEYARVRPKYYYYYEWMRKRLGERFPEGLPEPVVDKLLALDAGELDLLLQYPQAIAGQAAEFVQVLEAQGADALATYRSPTLSWEEVKALKVRGREGLAMLAGIIWCTHRTCTRYLRTRVLVRTYLCASTYSTDVCTCMYTRVRRTVSRRVISSILKNNIHVLPPTGARHRGPCPRLPRPRGGLHRSQRAEGHQPRPGRGGGRRRLDARGEIGCVPRRGPGHTRPLEIDVRANCQRGFSCMHTWRRVDPESQSH